MTLQYFESQLKKINPEFNIRQRGYNTGVGGIFLRNDFIVTLSQGHIPLNTMRYIYKHEDRYMEKIKKRGRAEIAKILNRRGLITREDSVRLKYGQV